MPTTLSSTNKDKITTFRAKIQYVENKIKDLRSKKRAEVVSAESDHDDAMQVINGNYDPQITTLEQELNTLNTDLEAVK